MRDQATKDSLPMGSCDGTEDSSIGGEAMRGGGAMRRAVATSLESEQGHSIWLHVYDLGHLSGQLNEYVLRGVNLGAFHCGVEVLGEEWSFQGFHDAWDDPTLTGMVRNDPRQHPEFIYRESINMGKTEIRCEIPNSCAFPVGICRFPRSILNESIAVEIVQKLDSLINGGLTRLSISLSPVVISTLLVAKLGCLRQCLLVVCNLTGKLRDFTLQLRLLSLLAGDVGHVFLHLALSCVAAADGSCNLTVAPIFVCLLCSLISLELVHQIHDDLTNLNEVVLCRQDLERSNGQNLAVQRCCRGGQGLLRLRGCGTASGIASGAS